MIGVLSSRKLLKLNKTTLDAALQYGITQQNKEIQILCLNVYFRRNFILEDVQKVSFL